MILLHKYWKTAALAATSYVGDSPLFLVDYLLRLLRVAVLLSLWRIILAGRGEESGLTLGAVLTYTLVAQIFAEQLDVRTELQSALWDGAIATRMLQPLGVFGLFAAEMFGRWWFGLIVFSLPLLACAPLFGVDPRPASAVAGALFLVSLVLGVSVGLALEFAFSALMVALELNLWAIVQIRNATSTLLSGALLPLALLPWGLGDVFSWLPFAAMASAPLRIYTGTGDPLTLMTAQVGWSLALWPLAGWLWRANRERFVSYGG